MGWTSKAYRGNATHTTLTEQEAFKFLKEEFNGYEFSMFSFKGARDQWEHNEAYIVMRHYVRMKTFILVTIIDIKDGEIYWKEIEESEGPAYTSCPAYFFKFITAPNGIAVAWREMCEKENIPFKPITEYYE